MDKTVPGETRRDPMATYCLSDIHGMRDVYHKMLEKIRFSPEDTLYIIGDVVDRGPFGIELLEEIMDTPNVTLLLGNHELMLLEYYSEGAGETEISRWDRNGNVMTKAAFAARDPGQQGRILSYIRELPVRLELTVGQRKFCLLHGYPGKTAFRTVWNRPTGKEKKSPVEDAVLIIGHTPVPSVLCSAAGAEERYFMDLERRGDSVKILHTPAFIDIDCCCGHRVVGSNLACLRLDDMEEFYVSALEA